MSLILLVLSFYAVPALAAGTVVSAAQDDVQEITVQAPKVRNSFESLLEVRKQKNVVADVLSQESMARSGDSDAAASLRRVTGLTLVGGKFVYVRGLGERYSSVLLNGAQVPSPEPSRRVVPLDLFPISVLESISVQKGFSPDKPGEFGGGLIDLQTKPLPRKFQAQIQVGANSDNFRKGLDHHAGARDVLGFDDGSRELPGSISSVLGGGRKLVVNNPPGVTDGVSATELTAMGRSLQNRYNTAPSSETPPPNFNLSIGNSWGVKSARVGSNLGLIYNQSTDIGEREAYDYNVGVGNQLQLDRSARTEFAEREVQLGAALDAGAEWGRDHQVKFTSLLLRSSTRRTEVKTAQSPSDSVEARRTSNLEWSERELFLNQVSGKNQLPGPTSGGIEIGWRANHSTAGRLSPDQRQYTYNRVDGEYFFNTDTTGNRRIWSELADVSREVALETNFKLRDDDGDKLHWKTGFVHNSKTRESDVYRLQFKNNFAPGSVPDLRQTPEDLFREGNIGPDGFQLTNLTESADSFTGEQDILSLYSAVEWAPVKSLEFAVGYRQETSRQNVRTFFYYDPNTPTSEGDLRMKNLLPAWNAAWRPNDSHRVKLGYSETLARPDFRELSSVPYIEEETGYEVVGNSTLQGTVIRNLDLRWEWYFGGTDYVSLGGFTKRFENPIEAVFEPGPNLRKTFENASSATNRGLEMEGRLGLGRFTRGLRRWSVLTNVSVIQSSVELGDGSAGVVTSQTRPLQGQSPYVANLQLLYDRPQPQVTAALVYNIVGKRITEVGTSGRPDVYEQPFHQLDFVYNQRVGDYGYGLRARNLLDPVAESTQGEEVVRSRKRGRSYVLTVSAYF